MCIPRDVSKPSQRKGFSADVLYSFQKYNQVVTQSPFKKPVRLHYIYIRVIPGANLGHRCSSSGCLGVSVSIPPLVHECTNFA